MPQSGTSENAAGMGREAGRGLSAGRAGRLLAQARRQEAAQKVLLVVPQQWGEGGRAGKRDVKTYFAHLALPVLVHPPIVHRNLV